MDQASLKSKLSYDTATGEFRWLASRYMITAGQLAGSIKSHRYQRIHINGKVYYGHRLAWLYVHGEFPPHEIDHINGDRLDNRLANLRLADRHQNGANLPRKANNSSGAAGVSWDRNLGKWAAYIHPNGRKLHLGYFVSFDDAVAARKQSERKHFGEFVRAA